MDPRFRLLTLALAALCSSLLSATDQKDASDPTEPRHHDARARPAGLSASDWSAIREAHMRRRHAAVAVAGGWRARNERQAWSAFFDGRGFEITPDEGAWRWGLQLTAYGYRGQERPVRRATALTDAEKFSYQWDEILREWYVNGEGLEHGYTLEKRPGTGTGLQFHLAIRGTLDARVAPDGRSVAFVARQDGVRVLNYRGLKVIDASGRVLASRFHHEHSGLRLEVDDADARYPIIVDPIAEQAHLAASNAEIADAFGRSVAIDGRFVIVGAPNEDSGGSNGTCTHDNLKPDSGAAYIFYRTVASGWIEVACLKASNADSFDRFGHSVAIGHNSRGQLRAVVGAWGEDGPRQVGTTPSQPDLFNVTRDAGAVYVFDFRSAICVPSFPDCEVLNGSWPEEHYLKGRHLQPDDHFSIVAMRGDTIVVGAFGDDLDGTGGSAPDQGAAYVFTTDPWAADPVWTQHAYLKPSCFCPSYEFGISVAISEDEQSIVAGAWRDALTMRSNAFVFTRTASGWSAPVSLQRPDTTAGTQFGLSVAMSGERVVVGAPAAAAGAGAAYVYTRSQSVWGAPVALVRTSITNVCTNPAALFGSSVAISGDTAVVGAPGTNGCGAAYVFVNSAGTWEQDGAIQASSSSGGAATGGDQYGSSVAVDGTVFIVGASNGPSNGVNGTGAAYVLGNPASLTSITIGAPSTFIGFLQSQVFTATGSFSDGSVSDISNRVTWESSTEVVILSSFGHAFGRAIGSTVINASLDGVTSNGFLLNVLPDTPAGTNVTVQPTDPTTGAAQPISLTFSSVTAPGVTTASQVLLAPPPNFQLKGTVYDVETTAAYTPPVTVCFIGSFDAGDQIMHYEHGGWVPLTANAQLLPPGGPYTSICADTNTLSPFGVFAPLGTNRQPTANAGASQMLEATSAAGASVTLSGTGEDPDDDPLVFSWSGPCGAASGSTVTLTCPLGTSSMMLTVSDGRGGSASSTVQISIVDTTPPSVVCGAPDTEWHAADVVIACSASDAVGLANPADASFGLTTSVTAGTETASATTVSRVVCDASGRCATAGPIGPIKVDKKGPVVRIDAPSNGATYALNQAVPTSFSCVDGGSGIASCVGTAANGAPLDTASEGTKSFSVAAVDAVGNPATVAVVYHVGSTPPFSFQGFFDPVGMSTPDLIVWNTVRAGQVVPIKWLLTIAGRPVEDPASFKGLTSHRVVCPSGAGSTDNVIEQAASGGSGLQYNGNGNWQFNWDTPKSVRNTCLAVVVKFSDGSTSPAALFNFK